MHASALTQLQLDTRAAMSPPFSGTAFTGNEKENDIGKLLWEHHCDGAFPAVSLHGRVRIREEKICSRIMEAFRDVSSECRLQA
jgi:hypothetical protein